MTPAMNDRTLESASPDEETLGLLRLILEGQAYRQLMLCNIRGHGVRFLPGIEEKLLLVDALDTSLRQFRELRRLYEQRGFGDVISAVRGKMERIPYPASRMELAVCLFVCERVQHLALETYVDCADRDFAAIARTRLEANRLLETPEDPAFLDFCADATHRPQAKQFLNRWLGVALLALGRPGSERDLRAVELGLRARSMGDVAEDFRAGLQPFVERCGLTMPEPEAIGVPPFDADERPGAEA